MSATLAAPKPPHPMAVLRMLKGAGRRFKAGSGGTTAPAALPVLLKASGRPLVDFAGATPPITLDATPKLVSIAFAPGVDEAAANGAGLLAEANGFIGGPLPIMQLVNADKRGAQLFTSELVAWIKAGTPLYAGYAAGVGPALGTTAALVDATLKAGAP